MDKWLRSRKKCTATMRSRSTSRIGNFLVSYSDLHLLATTLVSYTSQKSIQPSLIVLQTTKFAVYLRQVSLAACLK